MDALKSHMTNPGSVTIREVPRQLIAEWTGGPVVAIEEADLRLFKEAVAAGAFGFPVEYVCTLRVPPAPGQKGAGRKVNYFRRTDMPLGESDRPHAAPSASSTEAAGAGDASPPAPRGRRAKG